MTTKERIEEAKARLKQIKKEECKTMEAGATGTFANIQALTLVLTVLGNLDRDKIADLLHKQRYGDTSDSVADQTCFDDADKIVEMVMGGRTKC